MASYQSISDSSYRPEPGWRPKKSGMSLQQPTQEDPTNLSSRRGRREDGINYASSTQASQAQQNVGSRRPSITRPSNRPVAPVSNAPIRTRDPSAFGFARSEPVSAATVPQVVKDKKSRNVLRRKASTIAQHSATSISQSGTQMPSIARTVDVSANRVNRVNPQYMYREDRANEQAMLSESETDTSARIIPELDRYRLIQTESGEGRVKNEVPYKISTHDIPPPTPLNSGLSGHSRYSGNSGYSATSTRFSESPGPGAYSRDTTPTSMSSQSPGFMAPLRMTPRLQQISPMNTRPPLSGRRMGSAGEQGASANERQALSSLTESVTSSSSNGTAKGTTKDGLKTSDKKKKKGLEASPPPNPPPRTSSQKHKKARADEHVVSPTKASKTPAVPVMPVADSSLKRVNTEPERITSPTRPARPSREGTPNLQSQFGATTPVIQSNLTSVHMSPARRRGSGASEDSSIGPATSHSGLPQRGFSPSPAPQLHRNGTPRPTGLGIIPDLRPIDTKQSRQVAGSRTPSPSVAAQKPRFGLFGRRKTAPELVTTEKAPRKGPAAGTGHEGYGKYAMRGRSGSVGQGRDRSQSASSRDSVHGPASQDPFLLSRMSPVIIAGGGEIIENQNTSIDSKHFESDQLGAPRRPSIESKNSGGQLSLRSNVSKEDRTTLWPSALPRNSVNNYSTTSLSSSRGTYRSDSSDNESSLKPTLAYRRSIHKLKSAELAKLNLPKPIKIAGRASPAIDSQNSLMSEDARSTGAKPVLTSTTRKLTKRPRSPRKWNFFQRSTTSPKPSKNDETPIIVDEPEKSLAHYALIDFSSSEHEGEEPMDIETILREAEVIDLSRLRTDSPASVDIRNSRSDNIAELGPFLTATTSNEAAIFSSPEPMEKAATPENRIINERTGRPSRLPQVGRIPRVVQARPEQTSPKSFSRPFARVSMIQSSPNLAVIDRQSIALGPSPDRSPSRPVEPELASANLGPDETDRQFLVISPRKDSDATTSSSGGISYTGITAVIPEGDAALEEDEVWDEYDDLIEGGQKVPQSATSSHGMPFHLENSLARRASKRDKRDSLKSPDEIDAPLFMDLGRRPERLELTSSSVYSPDMSRGLKEAFTTPPLATPLSFTDFISGYGDRNNSIIAGSGDTRRLSSAPGPRDSTQSSRHSIPISIGTPTRHSGNSQMKNISEQSRQSPISQVNLRVGSMTVSKWLTFGHVLFSPIREEILAAEETPNPAKSHSVLVIDGLGNDDWSFYAAETYPSATFYNLSATPPRSAVVAASQAFPSTPPNHRQIHHPDLPSKFPFPSSHFSAVIVRFPPLLPDSTLRHLISEAKRVLLPGGYLELSVLDLDMLNMGNRCRRAVRNLKVKLSVANPDVSLASASDSILRHLGRRAFTEVKSCRVGVPVASIVNKAPTPANNGTAPSPGSSPEKEISLAELMRDESSAGDYGITKMVAKVGRWWYLRCYERTVITAGEDVRGNGVKLPEESIFADERVITECEKWGTSFKLMVCYARKPVLGRRRTLSI